MSARPEMSSREEEGIKDVELPQSVYRLGGWSTSPEVGVVLPCRRVAALPPAQGTVAAGHSRPPPQVTVGQGRGAPLHHRVGDHGDVTIVWQTHRCSNTSFSKSPFCSSNRWPDPGSQSLCTRECLLSSQLQFA